ncbi:hypothetical protein ANAPRD1_01072 [Anaplasma phagocytophilum]|nr:hypothetical protein ANAPC5_01303 [Anaplasma phagocytophilum]SCV66446.1 hypothetical protein ANAPRD1_01072 [Anaplasma phagocytophilum]
MTGFSSSCKTLYCTVGRKQVWNCALNKGKKRNGMHLEIFTVQVRGHFETLNFYTGCFLAEGGDARSDITRVWNRKPKRTENRN